MKKIYIVHQFDVKTWSHSIEIAFKTSKEAEAYCDIMYKKHNGTIIMKVKQINLDKFQQDQ